MRANERQAEWEKWRDDELEKTQEVLRRLHYTLDDKQRHVSGERFLMSGRKLVLIGMQKSDNAPVIIKWSTDESGMVEIRKERELREVLRNLHFANRTLSFPEEFYFENTEGAVVLVNKYIPQETIFIQLPITDQFFFALTALESQEGTHVATREHERLLVSLGGTMNAEEYLEQFGEWHKRIVARTPLLVDLHRSLALADNFLQTHKETIGRYCGVLTHTDFVPHNIRITGRQIVILDHTSLIIGNKYESWARFINFMALYNPELEQILIRYIKENRGDDEYSCLRAMRIYKLGFLLDYHTAAHEVSEGNLHLLTGERITFWGKVLESVIEDVPVSPEAITQYKSHAIALRSPEETERQQEISGWRRP